jgi:hypothetical protein
MRKHIFKAFVLLSIILISSCESDDTDELFAPTITNETTSGNLEANYTSIKISGSVSSEGVNEITSRGVCWSTSENPTIDDDKTTESSNTFTSTITDLVANTTYYFRIYATNSDNKSTAGTSYGAQQSFSTSSLDGTMWDFLITYDNGQTANGDVTFNPDGTTLYDEPSSPGTYTSYGTWSLNGNILTYDIDTDTTNNDYYLFTGTLLGNTMSGTATFNPNPINWSATEY